MITAEKLKRSIISNNISHWFPFKCSICGCKYGYYFELGNVIFDGACDCCNLNSTRFETYDTLIDLYNNGNDNFKKQFIQYFKLNGEI